MGFSLFLFAVSSAGALALCCARAWSMVMLLALLEVAWVALCGLYAQQLVATNEVFFLFWACVLLFFSAAELAVMSVLFLITTSATSQDAPLKK